jgi:large subunit ribosomal protein L1
VIDLVDFDDILQSVEEALEKGKGRNFTQSVELAINLRDLDMSDPNNRVDQEVLLPNGRGKEVKVGLFCSGEMATKSRDVADVVIQPEEIEELAEDKSQARSLAQEMNFFLAEAPLMPTIGRTLGVVLGPRGKMPTPLNPGDDPADTINSLRNTVRVRSKDKTTFHVPVAVEDLGNEEVAENVKAVIDRITRSFERGRYHLDSIYVKTTMGPAVRVL